MATQQKTLNTTKYGIIFLDRKSGEHFAHEDMTDALAETITTAKESMFAVHAIFKMNVRTALTETIYTKDTFEDLLDEEKSEDEDCAIYGDMYQQATSDYYAGRL